MIEVVFSLYGIESHGLWLSQIHPTLSGIHNFIHRPPEAAKRFRLWNILSEHARTAAVSEFHRVYHNARARYPDMRPSVIAHSFGTWVVAEALRVFRNDPDFGFHRVLLCGSVIDTEFDWDQCRVDHVRNEIGERDRWVKLLRTSLSRTIPGSGPSGVDRFQRDSIKLTQHPFALYGHSDFLKESHSRRYWIPFLRGTEVFADLCRRYLQEEPSADVDFDSAYGKMIADTVRGEFPRAGRAERAVLENTVKEKVIREGVYGREQPETLARLFAFKTKCDLGTARERSS